MIIKKNCHSKSHIRYKIICKNGCTNKFPWAFLWLTVAPYTVLGIDLEQSKLIKMKLRRKGDKPASAAVVGCGFASGSWEEDEPILFHVFFPPTAAIPSIRDRAELPLRWAFPHFPDEGHLHEWPGTLNILRADLHIQLNPEKAGAATKRSIHVILFPPDTMFSITLTEVTAVSVKSGVNSGLKLMWKKKRQVLMMCLQSFLCWQQHEVKGWAEDLGQGEGRDAFHTRTPLCFCYWTTDTSFCSLNYR